MTAKELLKRLDYDRLKITAKDGQLSLTGEKSKITPQILAEVQSNKSDLITILSASMQPPADITPGLRSYRREDGLHLELTSDEFEALVEFFEMVHSFRFTEK